MAKLQKACPWISNTNFSAVNLKYQVKKKKTWLVGLLLLALPHNQAAAGRGDAAALNSD